MANPGPLYHSEPTDVLATLKLVQVACVNFKKVLMDHDTYGADEQVEAQAIADLAATLVIS